jgi:phosphotransferase system HPr (HPr) family protein
MVSRDISLSDKLELTPNFIAELVQTACRFDSSSYIVAEDKRVNLKSIMGVMSLVTIKTKNITITTEGDDETVAMDAIEDFIDV